MPAFTAAFPMLTCETPHEVEQSDREARLYLVRQLRQLPGEVFTRMQYVQPELGCFNRCMFCCQEAGRNTWRLTRRGLRNLIAALADVTADYRDARGTALGAGRTQHRPGVLFPYLDNDIGSYPHLDEYLRLAYDELGCRVRLATVGFSSANHQLVHMHERIAITLAHTLAAVRFSWTPYTMGWTGQAQQRGETSRAQFISDFGSMLRTYRPVVERLGANKESGCCVELRFPPLVVTSRQNLLDDTINAHHVVSAGPHLLVSQHPCDGPVPQTRLLRVEADGRPVFSTNGLDYRLITSDTLVPSHPASLARRVIAGLIPTSPSRTRRVRMFRFANADGHYYAVDPTFLPNGEFRALHLYPRTRRRTVSGYTDATRWLLNTLIAYKASLGRDRRDPIPAASRRDIQAILDILRQHTEQLGETDAAAATHLRSQVIPLIEGYVAALEIADYEPAWFFHPQFTIDTGQIVNQGRAKGLFRGLVSVEDEPMTPREERGFGAASFSADRGRIWRLAPVPSGAAAERAQAVRGGKNTAGASGLLQVQELDPRHLRPVNRASGEAPREYRVAGGEIEHVGLEQGRANLGFPGVPISRARAVTACDAPLDVRA